VRLLEVPVGVGVAVMLTRAAWRTDARRRSRALCRTPLVLPARLRAPLARALWRADLTVSAEDAVRWWGVTVGAAAVLAVLVAPGLVVPVVVVTVTGGPLSLWLRAGRADIAARRALPGVIDVVVAHLRAGATVVDAIGALADRPGPLRADFARIRARLDLGAGIEAALAGWSVDRSVPGVRAVAGALALVAIVGGAAARPLEGLAGSLRDDDAAKEEARALTAQARMSAVVVGGAPLAYLLLSAMTDPRSVAVLVETGIGRRCLVAGLGIEALGAWWMYRLVEGRR
jgi:tight adherence protein B